jgi:Secretion system C-terminal sorting domain
MKTIITFLILFSIPLFSQDYLNVHYVSGTVENTSIDALSKITFSPDGDQINFYLTNSVVAALNISGIQMLTFDNNGNGNVLPVELSSFTSNANGRSVNLIWVTQTEKNSNKFDVQRELVNSEWITLGSVKAAVLSNSPKQYSYTDNKLLSGKYQYRLKMIDNDGSFAYSKVIEVDIAAPKEFKLSQNYPNPFNPETKIAYNIPIDGVVALMVYDIMGKEVISLINENKKAGSYEVTFDGSRLASGVYFCKMTAKNFTGSIKMILIK